MKQQTTLDILKTGQNVFLTGSAGAGKTYTLNQYLHYLRARGISVAVTASTGIAATHMNGMTIHSWAGIGISDEITAKDIKRIKGRTAVSERIAQAKVLIIDEISMLHRRQFDMINTVLKAIRQNDKPFGGIQLIVAGDFFQLPPVGERDEENRDKFAFMSEAWREADFQICYLTEQHRQTSNTGNVNDSYFGLDLTAILNQIREQNFTPDIVPALQATMQHDISDYRTRLYTHNMNVNRINEAELESLNTPTFTYIGEGQGDEKLLETLKKSVRNTPELTLKLGAKVMFIKNNADLNVSNGSMGEIVDFVVPVMKTTNNETGKSEKSEKVLEENDTSEKSDNKNAEQVAESTDKLAKTLNENSDNKKYPVVKLNDGRQVIAEPDVWKIEDEEGEILAEYYHVPLTLAWAITIHKSQGMTLDAAEIDLSKTFEKGQGYVALSRLKQLSGLKLLGLNDLTFQLDSLALGANKRFIEISQEQEAEFLTQPKDEIIQQQKSFILLKGGTLDPKKIEAYEAREQRLKTLKNLKDEHQKNAAKSGTKIGVGETQLQTKAYLEMGMSIEEISEQRELAVSTIIGHIEQLLAKFPDLDIAHIRPEQAHLDRIKTAYNSIKKANNPLDFNESGEIKLRSMFDKLQEDYSYNEIRLGLVLINTSQAANRENNAVGGN